MLEEVNSIIERLQNSKWSDIPPAHLDAAQGRLAVLSANVGAMLAEARNEMEVLELYAKNKQSEEYLAMREMDGEVKQETIKDADMKSRVLSFGAFTKFYEAKKRYEDIRFVYDAMKSIIIACQVTLRGKTEEARNNL